jgi:hypothetical protein
MKKHHVAVFALAGLVAPSTLLAQTNSATPVAPTYNQGQCRLSGIQIWKEGNAQTAGAIELLSSFVPSGASRVPTPAERTRLAQWETQKTQGQRFMIIGSKMFGALGSHDRGSAPIPDMASNRALIPIVQACLGRFTAEIEGAQSQRWSEALTSTTGEKSAIDKNSLRTVGSQAHIAVLTTAPSATAIQGVGQSRSSVTHWSFKCAAPRAASAQTIYLLQPGTDNIIDVQDLSAGAPIAITRPNSPIANLGRLACGETWLPPDPQVFPNLLAIVRNQEAPSTSNAVPSPSPKR